MNTVTQSGAGAEQETVELTLGELNDLFVAPELDPLGGQVETRSGMDRLVQRLSPRGPRLHLDLALQRLGVVLPGGEGRAPEDVGQLRTAIAEYARVRQLEIDAERARVRRLGIKELVFGCVFLMLCLIAGGALAGAFGDENWLAKFVSEGLVIVGWISLWHPVDMLFFERLPLIRDHRVLDRIRNAEVSIR